MVLAPSPADVAQAWPLQPILAGETVFVIGGGASLRGFDFGRLAGLRTIAVNQAAAHVATPDMLFFTDTNWFEANEALVRGWPGIAFTASRESKRRHAGLRQVLTTATNDFPPGLVRRGRSSGHTAVGLAIALGAPLTVLLGFDMHAEPGRSHFHDEYRTWDAAMYAREFIPSFAGWDRGARALGATVLNATPGSALDEFRRADLADLLHRS